MQVDKLNEVISETSKEIFLFGGHISSQFLVNFGLNTARLNGILDNSDVKNGKRLYGTRLYISKQDMLSEIQSPMVILKAGQYQEEIRMQLLNINDRIEIVE